MLALSSIFPGRIVEGGEEGLSGGRKRKEEEEEGEKSLRKARRGERRARKEGRISGGGIRR